MEKAVGTCGCDCSECIAFKKNCAGCRAIEGRVFWAPYSGGEICPLYRCCIEEKGLHSCGECHQLPCQLFYDTQDPSITQEEHALTVDKRVALLKKGVFKAAGQHPLKPCLDEDRAYHPRRKGKDRQ